ncbi:MAG: polyphosphate polymerase domain-containing protein [Rikenellaceae bacterium]
MESTIDKFQGISLDEMDGVKLMNRTDRKFWFHSRLLAELLEDVVQEYYILEINQDRNLPYSTTYYDTQRDEMYGNHHRGKLNRYKIRRRNYISTQSSFLEVKFKSNKGRTVKVRQASAYDGDSFDAVDELFIDKNSPYTCGELRQVIENGFRRLMLVSKAMNERCTIDSELHFVSGEREVSLEDIVIVEVKSDGRSASPIIEALSRRRLKPSGFSKYCVGRSLICDNLKHNNFKRKHRAIDKIVNNPKNIEV